MTGVNRITWDAIAKASRDPVKVDLELCCTGCGAHLCDIEAGDTLQVLADVADDHICSERRSLL